MGMMLRRRSAKPSSAYTNAEQAFKAMKEEQAAKAEQKPLGEREQAEKPVRRGGRRKAE